MSTKHWILKNNHLTFRGSPFQLLSRSEEYLKLKTLWRSNLLIVKQYKSQSICFMAHILVFFLFSSTNEGRAGRGGCQELNGKFHYFFNGNIWAYLIILVITSHNWALLGITSHRWTLQMKPPIKIYMKTRQASSHIYDL